MQTNIQMYCNNFDTFFTGFFFHWKKSLLNLENFIFAIKDHNKLKNGFGSSCCLFEYYEDHRIVWLEYCSTIVIRGFPQSCSVRFISDPNWFPPPPPFLCKKKMYVFGYFSGINFCGYLFSQAKKMYFLRCLFSQNDFNGKIALMSVKL